MMMAARAVCEQEEKSTNDADKTSPPQTQGTTSFFAHHRRYRPEAAAGRRTQRPPPPEAPRTTTTDRQSEKQAQQNTFVSLNWVSGVRAGRAGQMWPAVTCVFPPVLSCTRLLDMEQVMAKVWKKELMKLQRPRAISSWNTHVQSTGQCDGVRQLWVVPSESLGRRTGLQKLQKSFFFCFYDIPSKILRGMNAFFFFCIYLCI